MSDGSGPLSPSDFFAEPILILREFDAVRRRPQMYVGAAKDGAGLHNLVFAVVDDAFDQALADRVTVTLNRDGSVTVSDNGDGGPIGVDSRTGISVIELQLTTLNGRTGAPPEAPPPYATPPAPGETSGIGLAVINALSERFDLQIWRDGHAYAITFFHGDPVAPVRCVADDKGRRGREITFLPAAGSFSRLRFDRDVLAAGLSRRARRQPDRRMTLTDERGTPD